MKEKIERLEKENSDLTKGAVKLASDYLGVKRDNQSLILIIKNQAKKIDSFKKLFWRIYWRDGK